MNERNTVKFDRAGFKMIIRETEDRDVFLSISSPGGFGGVIVIPHGMRKYCIEALGLAKISLETWYARDTEPTKGS